MVVGLRCLSARDNASSPDRLPDVPKSAINRAVVSKIEERTQDIR